MPRALKTALGFLPLCLLALVVWREKPWTVQLSASAPWAVVASILVNFVVFLPLKAARWKVALTALLDPPPFRQVLAATIEGLLANVAIGFGSGDVVRAARLRRPDRGQMAVDYASTWAERGAEVLALAILVFVAALVGNLGAVALALSGLAVAVYVAVLRGGRVFGAAARALAAGAARAVGGAGGVDRAPGRGDGRAVTARLGRRARDADAVPGRVPPGAERPHGAADAGGDQRRHRDPDRARELRHLRSRRHDGAGALRRAARRGRALRRHLPPLPRRARGGGGERGLPLPQPPIQDDAGAHVDLP